MHFKVVVLVHKNKVVVLDVPHHHCLIEEDQQNQDVNLLLSICP